MRPPRLGRRAARAACALRAVARLPGRLSMRTLEKVLRGSRDRKLIADGKDGLPEFGGARALSSNTELARPALTGAEEAPQRDARMIMSD